MKPIQNDSHLEALAGRRVRRISPQANAPETEVAGVLRKDAAHGWVIDQKHVGPRGERGKIVHPTDLLEDVESEFDTSGGIK
jgi:hypothetical protein